MKLTSRAAWQAFALRYSLLLWRGLYQHTGNPIYAWEAWRLCRKMDTTPPAWALEYLDTCADNLLAIKDPKPKEVARAVAKSVGLIKGGPHTLFKRRLSAETQLKWARLADILITKRPSDQLAVFVDIACAIEDETGEDIDPETIRRWYYKFS